jgi:hypothetical protein
MKITLTAIAFSLLMIGTANAQNTPGGYDRGRCDSTCSLAQGQGLLAAPGPSAGPALMPATGTAGCNLPWGGAIGNGDSVLAWLFSSGGSGVCNLVESRICANGVLGGSYTRPSCSEAYAGTCGSANGTSVNSPPVGTALCAAGVGESAVTTTGTGYTWTCEGDGGITVGCSATKPLANKFEDFDGWCANIGSYLPDIAASGGGYICATNYGVKMYDSSRNPIGGMWTDFACANQYQDWYGTVYSRATGSGILPSAPLKECSAPGGIIGQEYISVIINGGYMYVYSDWYTGQVLPLPTGAPAFFQDVFPLIPKSW